MTNLDYFNKLKLNSPVYFISKKETLAGGLIQEKSYRETHQGFETEISIVYFNENEKSLEDAKLLLNNNQVFLTIEEAKEYLKKSLEQKIDNLCIRAENGVKILSENLNPKEYNE